MKIFLNLIAAVTFSISSNGQFLVDKTIDSSGNIFISTSTDTLAGSENFTKVFSVIICKDSINYYFMSFKIKSSTEHLQLDQDNSLHLYLDNKDSIVLNYLGDDLYVNKGDSFYFEAMVPKSYLEKMETRCVEGIGLKNNDLFHYIAIEKKYYDLLSNQAELLLKTNVYNDVEIPWSELTKFNLPEN